jgi:hypothetical protein
MPFRMHDYDNGLTGLAAFCDVCGDQITKNDGYIVWPGDRPTDFLVIHVGRCDPNGVYDCSSPLDTEMVYLANSTGIDLAQARKRAALLSSI